MVRNTKNFTMRHRLNRELDGSEDFTKRFLTHEYGNYDKYDKNRITLNYREDSKKNDTDKIYENYMELIKKLPTKEREEMESKKRDSIHDLLTN